MNAATERMTEVLKARDWNFEVDEENQMINTGCRGENGQWKIRAGGVTDYTCAILSRFPIDCPQPKRPLCAELLTRINFMLPVGCFEMDLEDGQIFFKTNMPYNQEPPECELLDNLLICNISSMDHYLPVIMQVIYAGVGPAKALADLKKADEKTKQAKTKSSKAKLTGPSRFQMN